MTSKIENFSVKEHPPAGRGEKHKKNTKFAKNETHKKTQKNNALVFPPWCLPICGGRLVRWAGTRGCIETGVRVSEEAAGQEWQRHRGQAAPGPGWPGGPAAAAPPPRGRGRRRRTAASAGTAWDKWYTPADKPSRPNWSRNGRNSG